jgi:hypothetical protein
MEGMMSEGSYMAFRAKAVPVSTWQDVQWQAWTMRGGARRV